LPYGTGLSIALHFAICILQNVAGMDGEITEAETAGFRAVTVDVMQNQHARTKTIMEEF